MDNSFNEKMCALVSKLLELDLIWCNGKRIKIYNVVLKEKFGQNTIYCFEIALFHTENFLPVFENKTLECDKIWFDNLKSFDNVEIEVVQGDVCEFKVQELPEGLKVLKGL